MQYKFEFQNQKFKIPSKLYPVTSPSQLAVFDEHSPAHPDIIKVLGPLLDSNHFEPGFCYTNTEKVVNLGKLVDLPIQFYTGWLFIEGWPVHHAWAVINDMLIDMSISITDQIIIWEEYKKDPKNWRVKGANRIRNKPLIPNSRDRIFVKIPSFLVYVGSPDDKEHAKFVFRRLMRKYPNHPSYLHEGMNASGPSAFQKILYEC